MLGHFHEVGEYLRLRGKRERVLCLPMGWLLENSVMDLNRQQVSMGEVKDSMSGLHPEPLLLND